jgi:hypothetical protein
VARLEATLSPALAQHTPSGERLGEAFETPWAEGGQFEQLAYEPTRRLADHNTARLG